MSVDPNRRMQRLVEVLPAVYDTRPGESLLGTLLLRVANELAIMDEEQRLLLHNRWLPLARGAPQGREGALDRLGAMLEAPRLDDRAPRETDSAYRARLVATIRALTGGMTTPRSLLELALSALGTEPCPVLDTRLAPRRTPDDPWVVDTTYARGMPPGTRRTCPGCRGGARATCARSDVAPLVEASLAENPLCTLVHRQPAAFWAPFTVESRSLVADRPVLCLTPLHDRPLVNPAIQSLATGEIALFEGFVLPGETLVLFPALDERERRRFDDADQTTHHAWLAAHPSGRAVLRSDAGERDVTGSVFYLSGSRFGELDSVFAGPAPLAQGLAERGTRFAEIEQAACTPVLNPGSQSWRLLQVARSGVPFWGTDEHDAPSGHDDDPPTRFMGADDQEGARFALWDSQGDAAGSAQAQRLFDQLKAAEEAAATTPTGPTEASLELTWFARPPARVQLRVLRSPQVERAVAQGALALLRADLDLARAAGIEVRFELRERPLPQDAAEPAEGALRFEAASLLREPLAPDDRAPSVALQTRLPSERLEPAEGDLAFLGIFDTTRLDGSRLA